MDNKELDDWLRATLADQELPAADILATAETLGISRTRIYAAKSRCGVRSRRLTYRNSTQHGLPGLTGYVWYRADLSEGGPGFAVWLRFEQWAIMHGVAKEVLRLVRELKWNLGFSETVLEELAYIVRELEQEGSRFQRRGGSGDRKPMVGVVPED